MRLAIEIGRFLLTAIAVAVVVPTVWLVLSFPESMSFGGWPDLFAMIALFTFALAILGGAFVGIPVWWLTLRKGWGGSLVKTTIIGAFTGGILAALMLLLASGRHIDFFLAGLPGYGFLGIVAGAVAGLVWPLLHGTERRVGNP